MGTCYLKIICDTSTQLIRTGAQGSPSRSRWRLCSLLSRTLNVCRAQPWLSSGMTGQRCGQSSLAHQQAWKNHSKLRGWRLAKSVSLERGLKPVLYLNPRPKRAGALKQNKTETDDTPVRLGSLLDGTGRNGAVCMIR